MASITKIQSTPEGYSLLQLSSANGPTYRPVKKQPVRDARPSEIPIIDVSCICSEKLQDRQAVADQIHAAATTIGFFYITNHGIREELANVVWKTSLEFFRQSEDVKSLVDSKIVAGYNGWKGSKTQQLNLTESIDHRETFSFNYTPSQDPTITELSSIPPEVKRSLNMELFPWDKTSSIPTFGSSIETYFKACLTLARRLLHLFALGLSLPETCFDAKCSYPDAALALNYYPSIPNLSPHRPQPDDLEVSIGSHTDFQLFTMLWQDSAGGLQVLNPSGEWIHAPPLPGSLVVNIGDYLQRITNDRYVSTVHRAKNHSGKERISLPFFFGFNLSETCGVLPSCVDENHPAKYEPISCEEWIRRRVANMYVDGG